MRPGAFLTIVEFTPGDTRPRESAWVVETMWRRKGPYTRRVAAGRPSRIRWFIVAPQISIDRRRIAEFCQRNHVRRLALFGSVLRDDFTPDSDVDVLVEFEPGHVPGFAFFDLQEELAAMLRRRVDLHTPGSLSRYLRDRVVLEAQDQYVAA
jgi:predicted nucleotidyltransferase